MTPSFPVTNTPLSLSPVRQHIASPNLVCGCLAMATHAQTIHIIRTRSAIPITAATIRVIPDDVLAEKWDTMFSVLKVVWYKVIHF